MVHLVGPQIGDVLRGGRGAVCVLERTMGLCREAGASGLVLKAVFDSRNWRGSGGNSGGARHHAVTSDNVVTPFNQTERGDPV